MKGCRDTPYTMTSYVLLNIYFVSEFTKFLLFVMVHQILAFARKLKHENFAHVIKYTRIILIFIKEKFFNARRNFTGQF